MDLSIVLVYYKTYALTLDCIASIHKFTSGIEFETIVVDNDSQDELEVALKQSYPQVHYYNTGYNAGFARANNVGIAHAKGNALLLINTDCIIADNIISACFSRLMKDAHAAAAGVQLYNATGHAQHSAHYFVGGAVNFLAPLPIWGNVLEKLAKRFTNLKTHPKDLDLSPREVDWVSGAFMMVKKTVINLAGPMDNNFFLYGEEIEWFSRIRKHGSVVFYPDLKCIHLEGESTKHNNKVVKGYQSYQGRKGAQLWLSNLLSVRKRLGLWWFLFHYLNALFALILLSLNALFTFRFTLLKDYITNFFKVNKFFLALLFNQQNFFKID